MPEQELIAPKDLRPEVVSLAREIERLPPGSYVFMLNKPDMKGLPWKVEIIKGERVRLMDLLR